MKTRMPNAAYRFAASPRLTAALLAYSVFLVFIGTLDSQFIGISAAQKKYFESFFCLAFGYVPLAGGACVGLLAAANIAASMVRYVKSDVRGLGILVTHIALVALIFSGALQFFMRTEGVMVLKENVPSNEVATGEEAVSGNAGDGKTIRLDFSVELKKFSAQMWDGSDIPRGFSSEIRFMQGESQIDAVVKINSPISFGGWTFYQNSYSDGGKTSVLSAVKNPGRFLPWLSVAAVFAGMALTFASNKKRKAKK